MINDNLSFWLTDWTFKNTFGWKPALGAFFVFFSSIDPSRMPRNMLHHF
ncbi:9508_t:CDS:2 [Entrophospora sp. SA101]|nr:9508_t:CDS:2 [Entrophospora sp. SA101]